MLWGCDYRIHFRPGLKVWRICGDGPPGHPVEYYPGYSVEGPYRIVFIETRHSKNFNDITYHLSGGPQKTLAWTMGFNEQWRLCKTKKEALNMCKIKNGEQ